MDDGWLAQLRRNMDAGEACTYSVSKRAMGARNVAIGRPEVHANCPVRTVRPSSVAAGSVAHPATIELVLATKGPVN